MHSHRRRPARPLALLLSFAFVAAACGSDGGEPDEPEATQTPSEEQAPAEPEPEPEVDPDADEANDDEPTSGGGQAGASGSDEGDSSDEAEGSNALTDPDLTAAFSAVIETYDSPEALFPCDEGDGGAPTTSDRGVTDEVVTIGFFDADLTTLEALNLPVPLGPESESFTAMMDYVNETCGGVNGRRIEVVEYTYDAINGNEMGQVCVQATQEDENFLIVTRVYPLGQVFCIIEENEHLMFYMGGRPTEFFERSGGRLFTERISESRGLALQIQDMVDTGLVGPDEPLGFVRADAAETNAIFQDIQPAFEANQLDVVDVQLSQAGISCDGYPAAIEQLQTAGVEVVIGLLSAICYPQLVAEASTVGYFPQWVATDWSSFTGDTSAQPMVELGDAFDGALGYSPVVIGTSEHLDGETAYSQACVDLVNERVGTDFEPGQPEFNSSVTLCSTAIAVVRGLQAAGTDLTQESFIAAMETVDEVPLHNNVVGSYGPGKPWAAPDVMHTVQWSIDCGCWITLDGPRPAELP